MKRSGLMLLVTLTLCCVVLYGCPKKAEVSSAPEKVEQAPAAPAEDAAKKAEEERARQAAAEAEAAAAAKRAEEEKAAQERAAKEAAGLQPVYFDFDKSFIRDDAKAVMKANAEWLKANPKVKVRIEGNCDERGTIEYNQALGQRRASAAKKYLTDLGIKSSRISLISYGKEKPVCRESTEECWQKNRRGDLVKAE